MKKLFLLAIFAIMFLSSCTTSLDDKKTSERALYAEKTPFSIIIRYDGKRENDTLSLNENFSKIREVGINHDEYGELVNEEDGRIIRFVGKEGRYQRNQDFVENEGVAFFLMMILLAFILGIYTGTRND